MTLPPRARIDAFLSPSLALWSRVGVDREHGGFVEFLSPEASPVTGTRRTLTQARQMYSFRIAAQMGALPRDTAHDLVAHGLTFLLSRCSDLPSLPEGAFALSTQADGSPASLSPELYTQAFCLFGLAQTERIAPSETIRARAHQLLDYLERERRAPHGGFTEIKPGPSAFASNPHMHLFEAALAWCEVAPEDARFRKLADSLAELCLTRFIDRETGLLAEFFDENWSPLREVGCFFWEPGHQYEWSWLLGWYGRVSGRSTELLAARMQLFAQAERLGLHPKGHYAIDEVWSDGRAKSLTSRFWPHTERIKAAVQLRGEVPEAARAAHEALDALFRYLDQPRLGLWLDQRDAQGALIPGPIKASSLYHIIGSLSEFASPR